MSRWRIDSTGFEERALDYTATFTCTEVDLNQGVTITLTQNKGEPAANLVGSLRALAQLMLRAAGSKEDLPGTNIQKLN
jgi:hypothetical protein